MIVLTPSLLSVPFSLLPSPFSLSLLHQVVAGTNFFIKVNVGDSHVHAKVFRSLPPFNYEVAAVQTGKSAEDPVNSF